MKFSNNIEAILSFEKMSKLHIYAFLIKIMSMNFHNMEYSSNINNIYKYIHNPYECLRGQGWPYSDSDNFGACTHTA